MLNSRGTFSPPSSGHGNRGSGDSGRIQRPSCLIIVAGLLRYYREGWAALRHSVIDTNPRVVFGVAVLTSAHLTCTDKDKIHGECPCIEKLPTYDKFPQTLKELITPTPLVYLQLSQHGGSGSLKPHFMYRLAQGWRSLMQYGIAQAYSRALVVRPDVVMVRPLRLQQTCEGRASFNIISGVFERPMFFHSESACTGSHGSAGSSRLHLTYISRG